LSKPNKLEIFNYTSTATTTTTSSYRLQRKQPSFTIRCVHREEEDGDVTIRCVHREEEDGDVSL
jgi:hypothetical protein